MIRQGRTVEMDAEPAAAFADAAASGFDVVELNMDRAFERSRVDPERIGRLADEHELDVVVHLPYRLDPGSPHEHVREGAARELEASLDAAAAMGAETAVFHGTSHARPEKWPVEEVRPRLFETVRRIHDHARDLGVAAAVENLKTPYFDVGTFPELFDATDAPGCLDTGHAFVSGWDGEDQADLLRKHGDRIAHLHLNDTRVGDEDEHLPVGLGRVDFAPIAAALVETDWSGTCTHEVWGFDDRYAAVGRDRFEELLAAARA